MTFDFWLIVTDVGTVSVRKNRPSLADGEVGIPMMLNVPAAWFSRTTPRAHITLPEPQLSVVAVEVGEVQRPMPEFDATVSVACVLEQLCGRGRAAGRTR